MPNKKKGKVLRNDESVERVPQGKNNKIFRNIRYKSDVKTLIVRTEVGYDLVFELQPQIRVNPYEATEKGTPEFQTSIAWTLKGARPRGIAMKVPQIKDLIKDRSLLPMDMDWDIAQIGFVYSNDRDPNNHRWWLEGLKAGTKMGTFSSELSEYMFDISSTAPIGTRSWSDGIFHGRFTISKDNIEDIIETSPGKIIINGNGKGKIGDIKANVDIPDTCVVARLRFDIRKNVWYTEFLDNKGVTVGNILTSANLMCDAKFKGHTIPHPSRPKVSGMVMRSDIISIKHDKQMTMIKGKA